MMNTLYPYYYEVKLYEDGEYFEEGGFAYASDWDTAAKDLQEMYKDSLLSMTIEMFDSYEFSFSLEKARKVKEAMGL